MKAMIGLCLIGLIHTHAVASNLTIADQEKQYQESLSWAQSAQQSITSQAHEQLNVADYCDDTECVNQVNNPPQKGLSDAAINNQKTTEFDSNDIAGALQENFDKGRPNVKTDPAYQYALLGQENAYEITHGLSNKYVNCKTGEQCLFEDNTKICHAPTLAPVPCKKTPRFTPKILAPSYRCAVGQLVGTQCRRLKQECRYDGNHRWVTTQSCHSGARSYGLWSGQKVQAPFFKGRLRTVRSTPCERGGGSSSYSLSNICRQVADYTPATPVCPNGYGLSGGQCVKNIVSWRVECTLIKACQPISERCIEGAGSRMINGVSTYLPCWKYEVLYECDLLDNCGQYAHCREEKRQCSLKQNGVCIEEEITNICTKKTCRTVTLTCGEQSFCLDGDCYESTPTQSDDFNESATGLAALSEAAKGLGDPPLIFTGKGMHCTDKAFGFADCCKDSGWGTGVGLAQCSEEEIALGQAKEQGITIALGEYCASKVLGVCTRKKKGYCVFDSKLARIVQEQGVKGQLGISLGSAEHPACDAITPEQLQKINFKHIDFSDFYDDMRSNTDLPSATEIQQRLKSAYEL